VDRSGGAPRFHQEVLKARVRVPRSGEEKVPSLRIDVGLGDSLKKRADEEGIPGEEALNRVLEGHLNG